MPGATAFLPSSRRWRAGGIERFADFTNQLERQKWFGEERQAGSVIIAEHGVGRIPARIEHAQQRTVRGQPGRQRTSAETRHHDVRDHEVDPALLHARDRQRFIAVARFEHRVARSSENLPHQRAHRAIVFDDENRLLSAFRRWRASRRRGLERPAYRRQIDAERRAFTNGAVNPDESVALLDDAIHGGEPETRALAWRLRREERIEDARLNFRGHADTGVADEDVDVAAGLHWRSANGKRFRHVDHVGREAKLTAREHGVACVDGQVYQRVLELRRINANRIQLWLQLHDEVDIRAKRPAQELLQV